MDKNLQTEIDRVLGGKEAEMELSCAKTIGDIQKFLLKNGVEISEADVQELIAGSSESISSDDLSEEALEGISGGGLLSWIRSWSSRGNFSGGGGAGGGGGGGGGR